MVSIIICSRNHDVSYDLKQNISETIGSDYEIIVIDNSLNKYSIFSAYNEGLKFAKGDVLCFMHEDICFHSNNWGTMISEYFVKYPEAGLVGAAGTHYLPHMPAAWWDTEMQSGQLIQGFILNGKYETKIDSWNEFKRMPTKVVTVDGFWMCFQKRVFDYIYWDDYYFKGFHCYDTDISLQVLDAGYEVHVFWDILIEHKSVGMSNVDFYQALNHLFKKWCDKLPLVRGVDISESEMTARLRIAELRHKLLETECQLKKVYKSKEYRWGHYLLTPKVIFMRIISLVFRR